MPHIDFNIDIALDLVTGLIKHVFSKRHGVQTDIERIYFLSQRRVRIARRQKMPLFGVVQSEVGPGSARRRPEGPSTGLGIAIRSIAPFFQGSNRQVLE